jgi:hypothetical protein
MKMKAKTLVDLTRIFIKKNNICFKDEELPQSLKKSISEMKECCMNNSADDAAKNGHLDCLKFAHENGCPWSENTTSYAARGGQLNCLKYSHENCCPCY